MSVKIVVWLCGGGVGWGSAGCMYILYCDVFDVVTCNVLFFGFLCTSNVILITKLE